MTGTGKSLFSSVLEPLSKKTGEQPIGCKNSDDTTIFFENTNADEYDHNLIYEFKTHEQAEKFLEKTQQWLSDKLVENQEEATRNSSPGMSGRSGN